MAAPEFTVMTLQDAISLNSNHRLDHLATRTGLTYDRARPWARDKLRQLLERRDVPAGATVLLVRTDGSITRRAGEWDLVAATPRNGGSAPCDSTAKHSTPERTS